MKVEGFLCDAATVREGLLHLLGAGVTRLWRDKFPAPLGIQLAMMLTLKPVEAKSPHQFQVLIVDDDGKEIAKLDGQLQVGTHPHAMPGELVNVPLVLSLGLVAVPKAGTYSVEVLMDSQSAKTLSFFVGTKPATPPTAPPSG